MKRLLLALTLLLCAGSAAAQQRPPVAPPQQDTLTPEQRALERLRAMQRVGQPDTVRLPGDSIRAQQVEVRGPRTAAPPPSPIERDSIMDMLLRIGGYIGTEYRGDTANFAADSSVLVLLGKAQVAREGYQLVADSSITYDDRVGEACGYGSPVLHAPGMGNPITSSMVCYDVRRQRGFARGARTQVDQGATWLVSGDMYYVGEDIYSHDAVFTDCNDPEPHYHFAAKEMKVVRNNILVARNVTMSFRDVKVFWLPFFVQSLSRGRRSGILMPRFGINDIARTSARYSRRIEDVGLYWAINEHLGSELAMDWWSDNYVSLRGSFDYNFPQRFLTGGLTYRHFWQDEGGSNYTLASQNNWQIDERTRVSASANFTTSSQFVRQRTISPLEMNRSIDSNASLSRRFDWGNLSAGAVRKQYLTDGTVTARPSVNLMISPITLFEALPGEERFYSGAVWDANISGSLDTRDISDENVNLRTQSRRALQTNVGSGLQLGGFRLGTRMSFDEERLLERAFAIDTIPQLPGVTTQRGTWDANLNYTINLPQSVFGNTTITPGVALGGQFARNDRSGNELVSAPVRADFSAGLSTNLYRFFPGVGSLERIRHRISPSLSYNYAPLARADSLQREVFTQTLAERNTISLNFSQTFEGKFRGVGTDTVGAAPRDTLQTARDSAQGPRRRQQTQAVVLLSINTSALAYDFVRARDDGRGFTATQISNDIQSDLLRGLSLRLTHDLWRDAPGAEPGSGDREFAPHLSNLSTSFSLNGNSWLFRLLRLGSSDSLPSGQPATPLPTDSLQAGPAVDRTGPEYGMIGTTRRTAEGAPRGSIGAWNATFNYTLTRPRQQPETSFRSQENSMLNATFAFQPTENWTVNWRTGYSFTTDEFTDHILTLTRTLHDWDANFNFTKTQNGNFAFTFGVHLRANPDIKLDYSQSDLRGLERR